MTRYNMQFLSSVLVLSVFGVTCADAAPSVRMLGANSARVGTNATVVKSDNNSNANTSTQRLGTIRSKAVNSGAPVAVNKVATPSAAANPGSDARLSLGKYIHATGLNTGGINPGTSLAPAVQSADLAALSDQIGNLKNTKQDTITTGEGLVLDDDNKLSLDSTVLQAQMESALEDYYTMDDIDEMLENVSAGDLSSALSGKQDTIADLDNIRSGAALGASAVQPSVLATTLADYLTNSAAADAYATKDSVAGKQDKIADLDAIRSGAALGSTALQQNDLDSALSGYYTKGEVDSKISSVVAGDISSALSGKQDTIADLDAIRSGAELGASAVQPSVLATTLADYLTNSVAATTYQPIGSYATTDALAGKQDTIADLDAIRSGAALGSTALQQDDLTSALVNYMTNSAAADAYATKDSVAGKQDTIADLDNIRSGAALGASAVQPSVLATTLADYLTNSAAATTYQPIGSYATTEDLGDYYTKSEVDSKVANIVAGDLSSALTGKQDTIADLDDIRSGAALGSTALQQDDLTSALVGYLTNSAAATTYQPIGSYATTDALAGKQDKIADLDAIRSGAALGSTALQQDDLTSALVGYLTNSVAATTYQPIGSYATTDALAGKQDKIADLDDIRSGAELGASAVQPSVLATTLADYLTNSVAATTYQPIGSYATTSDLGDYYTKSEVDSKVANIVAGDISSALTGKQDTIEDLDDIRSGAQLGASAVQPSVLATTLADYLTNSAAATTYQPIGSYATTDALAGKQDTIADLDDIRSGAELGASAVQPSVLATTLADYLTNSAAATTYQPIGSYATASDLDDYALASSVYTKGEADAKYQLAGSYATISDLEDYALASSVPTKTSELDNDSGFLTAHQDISGLIENPTLPTNAGNFMLKLNRDDNGTYTYSWESISSSSGSSGGGTGGGGTGGGGTGGGNTGGDDEEEDEEIPIPGW